MTTRVAPVLAASLLAVTALAGCGGDDEPTADEPTPAEVLAEAKQAFDDASSVRLELSTDAQPSSGNGVLGAEGVLTPQPAFEGQVRVLLNNLAATVPVVSVDGDVYAQIPLLGPGWRTIDPTEYGAPDPAEFADPEQGLSALLTELEGAEEGEQTRDGDTILTTYSGELPGTSVQRIIPSADDTVPYPTTVGVDDEGRAVSVSITGPFFGDGGDVTYDVGFSDYDAGATVEAPAT
ncbi:LppX_LprAFG lipoprotein [Nocardioides marmoraquaticus]